MLRPPVARDRAIILGIWKNIMKQSKQWLSKAIVTVVATGLIGHGVRAQPGPANGGDATGGGNANGGGNGGGQNLTPEQRQQAMEQRRDESLHSNLTTAGFTDKTLQDAVVAYVDAYEKAKQPLRDQGAKVVAALRDKAATDAQLTTALADFRTAAATLLGQRKVAQADLDTKIGYTKTPRLEAYLTMIGVLGDEASLLGQIGGGGRGGAGRGGNGGFNGRGGNGAGNNGMPGGGGNGGGNG